MTKSQLLNFFDCGIQSLRLEAVCLPLCLCGLKYSIQHFLNQQKEKQKYASKLFWINSKLEGFVHINDQKKYFQIIAIAKIVGFIKVECQCQASSIGTSSAICNNQITNSPSIFRTIFVARLAATIAQVLHLFNASVGESMLCQLSGRKLQRKQRKTFSGKWTAYGSYYFAKAILHDIHNLCAAAAFLF